MTIAKSDIFHPKVADVVQLLIQLYEAWNKPEKAAEWRTKLLQKGAKTE